MLTKRLKKFVADLKNICIINDGLGSVSDLPDVSECLRDTLLVWIPCSIVGLCCFIWLRVLVRKDRHEVKRSGLNKLRTALCLALSCIYLWKLFRCNDTCRSETIIKYSSQAVATVMLTAVTWIEYKRLVGTSGVVSLAWLQLMVFGSLEFRSTWVKEDRDFSFLSSYFIIILQFVLCFFTDRKLLSQIDEINFRMWRRSKAPKPCPEESSGFFSRLTFYWITSLMWTGYHRTLTYRDLYDTRGVDRSRPIIERFERCWDIEVLRKRIKIICKKKIHQRSKSDFAKEMTAEDQEAEERARRILIEQIQSKLTSRVSLVKVMAQVSGLMNIYGGILKFLYDLIAFLHPILINQLITFIKSESPKLHLGLSLVAGMLVVSLVRTFLVQHFWNACLIVGQHLRTAIVGVVYRKSLRLSNTARTKTTVGEIVNLMSVDAKKFDDAPCYVHMLWSTPVTIAVAVYMLWQFLGPSALAGLLCMVVMIPINALLAFKNKKFQVEQMRLKDVRIKMITEILNGIKVLKLYSWEEFFTKKVINIRNKEVKVLRMSQFVSAVSAISWFMTPFLVALSTFTVYVISSSENVLDANKAFVSLSLFNILSYPISILPLVINLVVQVSVSTKRIKRFLLESELQNYVKIDGCLEKAIAIKFVGASFGWIEDEPLVLKNIDLTIEKGKLVALIGQVGSGKTALLAALCGEMDVHRGQVAAMGSIAYVAQQAWIQNNTIRENILFAREYMDPTYHEVIDACALKPDLDVLPASDQTEIGEKGINLSGGQKQRLSLARAIYQHMDIYLLDDPLSAVDAHVGEHIFNKVIGKNGILKDKTRILVTNNASLLPDVDLIVVLKDGTISQMGTYDELVAQGSPFAEPVVPRGVAPKQERVGKHSHFHKEKTQNETTLEKSDSLMRRRRQQMSITSSGSTHEVARLMTEELTVVGKVKLAVFMRYIGACRIYPFLFFISFYVWFVSMQISTNLWLSAWSDDPPGTRNGTSLRDYRVKYYALFGLAQGLAISGTTVSLAVMCTRSSEELHSLLLRSITSAPMSFYDTTPLGRIINRFSRDVDILDVTIPVTMRIWFATFSGVVSTFFVISYTTPTFLAALPILGLLYYLIQSFYISTSRQLRRMDSNLASPIYTHFAETVMGSGSIRAYRDQERFISQQEELLDRNIKTHYLVLASNRWLGVWLETLGTTILVITALFCVLQSGSINPGLAGLSLTYSLQVTLTLNTFVRMMSELENNIVSVERIDEYIKCPQEPSSPTDVKLPPTWPQFGRIEFQNYSTRYREGLENVINNLSCVISAGEKVGIVGRTGAGKSSMALALFRIIEGTSGSISIDNVAISTLSLRDLRSRLTIIPQDPVLFSDTLRMNVDPSGLRSDLDIWNVLELAHLKGFVASQPKQLDTVCSEGGGNLSIGQRQLLCLARALLRKTRVLVMDEATAFIDLENDELLHKVISTHFDRCTVMTIAHRINTIINYDRILVMESGGLVEFDSPKNLLENTSSKFYSMAKSNNLVQ